MKACMQLLRLRLLLAAGLALQAAVAGASCTVETVAVVFGPYDAIAGTDLDGVGSITVSCAPGADYRIDLSAGSGSHAVRALRAGAVALAYNLYTDAGHNMVWGDGSAGTVSVHGTGSGQTHTVYGRIPGGQTQAVAGVYTDVIVVTVEF